MKFPGFILALDYREKVTKIKQKQLYPWLQNIKSVSFLLINQLIIVVQNLNAFSFIKKTYLILHLLFFLDGTLVQQILAYKMQTKRDESITDICDGKLYKERFQKNGFFQWQHSRSKSATYFSPNEHRWSVIVSFVFI